MAQPRERAVWERSVAQVEANLSHDAGGEALRGERVRRRTLGTTAPGREGASTRAPAVDRREGHLRARW